MDKILLRNVHRLTMCCMVRAPNKIKNYKIKYRLENFSSYQEEGTNVVGGAVRLFHHIFSGEVVGLSISGKKEKSHQKLYLSAASYILSFFLQALID